MTKRNLFTAAAMGAFLLIVAIASANHQAHYTLSDPPYYQNQPVTLTDDTSYVTAEAVRAWDCNLESGLNSDFQPEPNLTGPPEPYESDPVVPCTYAEPGDYNPSLRVTDHGESTYLFINISVGAQADKPSTPVLVSPSTVALPNTFDIRSAKPNFEIQDSECYTGIGRPCEFDYLGRSGPPGGPYIHQIAIPVAAPGPGTQLTVAFYAIDQDAVDRATFDITVTRNQVDPFKLIAAKRFTCTADPRAKGKVRVGAELDYYMTAAARYKVTVRQRSRAKDGHWKTIRTARAKGQGDPSYLPQTRTADFRTTPNQLKGTQLVSTLSVKGQFKKSARVHPRVSRCKR